MTRTSRWLLPLALFAISLGPAASAAEVPIGGSVVGPDGLPFPDAVVRLLPELDPLERYGVESGRADEQTGVVSRTDRDGLFRLDAPAPGSWYVRVEADGFVPMELGLRPLLEPVELPELRLVPGVDLTMTVTAAGRPVEGARVQVRPSKGRLDRFLERAGGGRWTIADRVGYTAADGTVVLARSHSERLDVTISAAGFAFEEPRDPRGTAIETVLREQEGREVRIVDEDGRGVAGVLLSNGEHGHPLGVTDGDGHASVPLPREGEATVVAVAPDGRSSSARLARTVDEAPPKTLALPRRVVVAGKVIDADTGKPVTGALVWAVGEPWRISSVDGAGGFVLGGGKAERLRVVAGAPGYLRSVQRELVLDGDGRPGPALALYPGAAIEGRVVDEGGEPVSGAEVDAEVKRPPSGMIRIEIGGPGGPPTRALTDSRGRFRISPLDPDKSYIVKAHAEGHAEGRAEVLALEPRRTRAGVVVRVPDGQTVTGAVTDVEGAPLEGAEVLLKASPDTGGMGGRHIVVGGDGGGDDIIGWTDGEGRFRIGGVRAAPYDVEVRRAGFAPGRATAIEVVASDEPVDVGTFRLKPGAGLQGIVLDPDGAAIEGVEVRATQGSPGGMAGMMIAGGPGQVREPDAVTAPDGWFVVSDLEPGTAASLTFSRPGWVRKTEGGVDVPSSEPLSVTLDPSSTVDGRVVGPEGEPLPHAAVELTRTMTGGGGGRMFRFVSMESTQADGEGRFRFEDVDPGTISLAAEATGWQKANRDGIEVPKGENLEGIELSLEPGAILMGRVSTPDGRGTVGATVREISTGGEPLDLMTASVETDGDGYYRMEGLAPSEVSIEATHPSHVRTVRDVRLEPGINYLDLQFEGGQEVSGTVTDPAGAPVAGSWVRLAQAGRRWGGPEATTGPDGEFRIEGVADGEYTIEARAEGFAPYRDDRTVEVAGQPVAGVFVTLQRGEVLSGRVLGVEPEDFPEIEVEALGLAGQGFAEAVVDREGTYRIDDLAPGRYRVVARQGRTGRQASGETSVEQGAGEHRLDLEFGRGLTLDGVALLGERPFAGASVLALGADVRAEAWGETDREGRFRLDGLEPGTYQVEVRHWTSGISHKEEIAVEGNREVRIDIPTALVSGRVIDAVDRAPLAGVRVSLAPPDDAGPSILNTLVGVSDLDGRFRIGNVPNGSHVLYAGMDGYATATHDVSVQEGRDVDDLRVEMDPTDGLSLRVRLDGGTHPRTVRAAVLDGAGRPVVQGTYDTGESGSVRLRTVPAGTWEVVLAASGAGTLRAGATAPGGPVDVRLPPACVMGIEVPALEASGVVATATLVDERGRPFRGLSHFGDVTSRWQVIAGRAEIAALPPGSWTVRVEARDGRSWESRAATTAGDRVSVVLE